jgi:hypothetical protein
MATSRSPAGSTATVVEHPDEAPAAVPSVWLVVGDKLGDNAQIEVIAAALGWPVVTKRLRFGESYVFGKPTFKPALYHIDPEKSDRLEPPWPDLVLTVGRRPSMAALWIRKQSADRTNVVIVGRPRRFLDDFALVLATPQYRLPARPNVMHLDLPLMRVDAAAVARAADAWRERLNGLPRPLTAVLVGGPTKPFVFTAAVAREFVRRLGLTTAGEGALFVTTSRRTPEPVVDALAAALPAEARLFRWRPDATENPYTALLGLADRFVVTGDSVSMIVEVARLGKPLAIFELPVTNAPWDRLRRRLAGLFQPPAGEARAPGWPTRLGDALYDLGLVSYSRDFSALHRRLVIRGAAVFLGQPFPAAPPAAATDDLPEVVARIRALVANRLQ